MKRNKKLSKMSLKSWMITENIIIVISSIMMYELVDFGYNYLYLHDANYNPITGLGMFLPMSLIIYGVTSSFSLNLYQYISILTNAIKKVADGNFNIKIDKSTRGPLKDVYSNFNTMCNELKNAENMKNDFLNEFSHEFKTPLASINGFANLLLEGECTEEQKKKYLEIISKESERLVTLTQNQLLLSKLEAQQIVLDKKKYRLDEQIRQCVIMLVSQWQRKCIDMSINLDDISFYGSEDLMQHVWINLITNAIRYTPEHGEISIDSEISNDKILIHVKDSGIGITKEQLSKIFDKYYRADINVNIKM